MDPTLEKDELRSELASRLEADESEIVIKTISV